MAKTIRHTDQMFFSDGDIDVHLPQRKPGKGELSAEEKLRRVSEADRLIAAEQVEYTKAIQLSRMTREEYIRWSAGNAELMIQKRVDRKIEERSAKVIISVEGFDEFLGAHKDQSVINYNTLSEGIDILYKTNFEGARLIHERSGIEKKGSPLREIFLKGKRADLVERNARFDLYRVMTTQSVLSMNAFEVFRHFGEDRFGGQITENGTNAKRSCYINSARDELTHQQLRLVLDRAKGVQNPSKFEKEFAALQMYTGLSRDTVPHVWEEVAKELGVSKPNAMQHGQRAHEEMMRVTVFDINNVQESQLHYEKLLQFFVIQSKGEMRSDIARTLNSPSLSRLRSRFMNVEQENVKPGKVARLLLGLDGGGMKNFPTILESHNDELGAAGLSSIRRHARVFFRKLATRMTTPQ